MNVLNEYIKLNNDLPVLYFNARHLDTFRTPSQSTARKKAGKLQLTVRVC